MRDVLGLVVLLLILVIFAGSAVEYDRLYQFVHGRLPEDCQCDCKCEPAPKRECPDPLLR